MNIRGWFQLVLYMIVLLALVRPLGAYMARVYERKSTLVGRIFGPLERLCYRLFGVDPSKAVGWKRHQSSLPLNPAGGGA